jgi:hypothetical protein
VAAGSGREGAARVMLDLVRGQRRPSRQRQRRSKATAADLLHQGWKTSWVKWASGASKARRATAARKNTRRKQMASRFFGPKCVKGIVKRFSNLWQLKWMDANEILNLNECFELSQTKKFGHWSRIEIK